jgi:ribosome-associated heat shock protein Hsp15
MDEQRLDKWLWCARFFKTRTLAAESLKTGRVDLNGQLAKPAKQVRQGDRVLLRMPPFTWDLEVTGLAPQRGNATLAATLFREGAGSIEARKVLSEHLRLTAVVEDPRQGKLSKKNRREREAFKRSGGD